MANVTVSWGNKSFKGNPTLVYKEIFSIGDEVKPQQMVDYARNNPDSELHKCFTWDDTIAAEKYRVFEARQIQCNLMVHCEKPDEPKEKMVFRATIQTKPDRDAGYKETVKVLVNKDDYASALETIKGQLKSFEQKYRNFKELKPIWDLIEAL